LCRNDVARERRRAQLKGSPYSDKESRYLPKLRQTREELGLSVTELAHLSGLHRSTINNYESGKRRAKPLALRKLLPVIAQCIRERDEA
jgi:DNA-binding XRE family transcriptional regulator